MTTWTDQRAEWVKTLTSEQIVTLTEAIVTKHAPTDENEGDRSETTSALLWLRTRGAEGEEFGIVGSYAQQLDLWAEKKIRAEQYPEHAKLNEANKSGREEGDVIHDFLTWLESQGIHLATYQPNGYRQGGEDLRELQDIRKTHAELIHEFHGVDTKKIDVERDQMLQSLIDHQTPKGTKNV